ncbi:Mss4-like protein [Crepidotus variabilis]|uniref:Mss4-like protein n=1 Tax=Crepidotus variabilis TaxID=179855 RepID=A0A9P6JIL6_9AGAR|nr:Mss4-like protein [Crepidotus variabilis]
MSSTLVIRRGSCICKAVRYTITGDPITFRVCHCSHCKKASGSAFLANAFFEEKNLQIVEGRDSLTTYPDMGTSSGHPLERFFCNKCGSNVFLRSLAPEAVKKNLRIVALGTLDDEVDWLPRKELFPENRRLYLKGIELSPKSKL